MIMTINLFKRIGLIRKEEIMINEVGQFVEDIISHERMNMPHLDNRSIRRVKDITFYASVEELVSASVRVKRGLSIAFTQSSERPPSAAIRRMFCSVNCRADIASASVHFGGFQR